MTDKEKRRAVRKEVDKMAKSRTVYFMPVRVAKQLNLKESEVLKYLYELTEFDGILEEKYKFYCPTFYCPYTKIFEQFTDKYKELICPCCGETIQQPQITENTYLIFKFKNKECTDENKIFTDIEKAKKVKDVKIESPYKDYINFLYTKEDEKI